MKTVFLFTFISFLVSGAYCQNYTLIKDITAGPASSFTDDEDTIIGHLGDKLLFVLRDSTGISHLYVTDGSNPGTIKLQTSASANERFIDFVKADTVMSYVLYDQVNLTYKLHTTNAVSITLLNSHSANTSINNLHFFNGQLYYTNNAELRKVDLANTSDTLLYTANDNIIDYYFETQDSLYFAVNSINEDTLFVRNLSLATQQKLGAIGNAAFLGLKFQKVNNRLIMFNEELNDTTVCYSTDGTSAGTLFLQNFSSSGKSFSVIYNGNLYFDADSSFDYYYRQFQNTMWVSDGTLAGTSIFPINTGGLRIALSALVFQNDIYFVGSGFWQDGGYYLYKHSTLWHVEDWMRFGSKFYMDPQAGDLITVNGKLYVAAYWGEGTTGNEICELDQPNQFPYFNAYETIPGPATLFYSNLYATDTKIFFVGDTASTGKELYSFNPVVSTTITNIQSPNKINETLFSCYPNPFSEELTLENKTAAKITSIRLKDITGKLIREYFSVGSLNIENIDSGFYCLEIATKNTVQVIKVLKK
jgi:hypothetical protein